jgi:transcriptional regulator GlxA family with amidase domain
MDQLLERNAAADISFSRFATPATYVVATPGAALLHGNGTPAAGLERASFAEILAQRFSQVDDQGVASVYSEVLSAVENDRRRRALERSRQAFETVLSWVDGNISTTLEFDAISRGTRLSSVSVRRLIREHCSMSVASFIRSRRIAAALAMLATSPKRLSVIAALCGFASQSHFSRSIRAEVGVTPSQYRKRYNERAARSA